MTFLQELTRVQYAMKSHFSAVRIARRLSGCHFSQATENDAYLQFDAGSLGADFFSYLVSANTGLSGWSSWVAHGGVTVKFAWSLEAEAASDGGW